MKQRTSWLMVLIGVLSFCGITEANSPFLVKDIRQSQGMDYSSGGMGSAVLYNNQLYFLGSDIRNGAELWKTDGTPGGTQIVRDINPGRSSSICLTWLSFQGSLLLAANDGTTGCELWKSDGSTEGTLLLKDLHAGNGSSNPGPLIEVNGVVMFLADDGVNGRELWRTDATSAGTVMVKDLTAGASSSTIQNMTRVGNLLYFFLMNDLGQAELWKSDGTQDGTVLVKNVNLMSPSLFIGIVCSANNILFFTADDGIHGYELWRSDGTEAGTYLVRDIWEGNSGSSPFGLTFFQDKVYFNANDGIWGRELWQSDGTEEGTMLVADIYPGSPWGMPQLATVSGGLLYFQAQTTLGYELWSFNGTSVGLVKDIGPGVNSFGPSLLTDMDGVLIFVIDDGLNGGELWRSDGSSQGTYMIKDIWPGPTSSNAQGLKVYEGNIYFSARDGVHQSEVWKSDGTSAGTMRFKDIDGTAGSSDPTDLTAAGDILFFSSNDGISGEELWKSNGTADGTELVHDTSPGPNTSWPLHLTALGNQIVYVNNFTEVWRSDGTSEGTFPLLELQPEFGEFTTGHNLVFFSAKDGPHGNEPWKTDGTINGTSIVKDIIPGIFGSGPQSLRFLDDGFLYFSSGTLELGYELWKTDGNEENTELIKDINPSGSSSPKNFTSVNGIVLFQAEEPPGGVELWRTDGTEEGTTLVKDINPAGNSDPQSIVTFNQSAIFSAEDEVNGRELWYSDGSAEATTIIKDIHPGVESSNPASLVRFADSIFFIADDGTHGRELWKTDGSLAGTSMVLDILPGPASSLLEGSALVPAKSYLYFSASNGVDGLELWKTDGTSDGTSLVMDLAAGPASSNPEGLTVADSFLFFTAETEELGKELWAVDLCSSLSFSDSLSAGILFMSYTDVVSATGGIGPYSYSVTSGVLPDGLTMTEQGSISGTPTATGTFNFDVTATDNNGCTGSRSYSITIECGTITLSPLTLPDGVAQVAYDASLSSNGGTAPISYAVTSGSLPDGLSLANTGAITGTPTKTGEFDFVVTATDSNGCSGNRSYEIEVSCGSVSISPEVLPHGAIQVAYTQILTASGGTAPYAIGLSSGELPPGLILSETGEISGIPTVSGDFLFGITATDENSCEATKEYSISTDCLFCDHFEDGVVDSGWLYTGTTWTEDGHNLIGAPGDKKATAVATPAFSGCSNCYMEANVATTQSGGIVWILGWYKDKKNAVELLMKEDRDKWLLKERVNGRVVAKAKGNHAIDPNIHYRARINFDGSRFEVFIDGVSILSMIPLSFHEGSVAFKVKNAPASFAEIIVN